MLDWIKEHPYLTGGLVLGAIVLWVILRSGSSSQSTAASTTVTGSTGPDDTIAAAEIAAGTQIGLAQVAANAQTVASNAQTNQLQIAAQVQNLQTGAGVAINNQNTQASLTLGLAQAGQGTNSILELLGAQPGASPVAQGVLISGIGPSVPGGGGISPPPSPTGGSTGSGGSGGVSSGVGPGSSGAGTAVNPVNPNVPGSGPVTIAGSGSNALVQPYQTGVTGVDEETGASYGLNPDYYATSAAAAQFAGILGLTEGNAGPEGGVGSYSGPFVNPNQIGFNVTAGAPTPTGAGTVSAGEVINQLQSTPPGLWASELGAYGISLTPAQESQIYASFGTNQAVPEMHGDSTQGETQGASSNAPTAAAQDLVQTVLSMQGPPGGILPSPGPAPIAA